MQPLQTRALPQRRFLWRILIFGLYLIAVGCFLARPSRAQTSRPGIPSMLQRSLPSATPPKLQHGTYLTSKTRHFVFQYPRDWRTWVKILIDRSEQDLRKIETSLGFRLQGRLRVRFAPGGRDYAKIQPFPWHPPSYIAGLAYPQHGIMTLRLRGIDGLDGTHQTFRHELSHLLLARAAAHHSMPLWFIEGLAMLHSDDFGTLDRMWLLARARVSGRWPSLAQLQRRFPPNYEDRRVAYAVSFDFVAFLQKQKPDLVPQLLASMRHGTPFLKALQQSTGQSWQTLQQSWLQQTRLRYGWFTLLTQEWLIWLLAIILLIAGYLRLKRRRRAQLQEWEEQESDDDTEPPWYPPRPRTSYPFPTQHP